MTHEAEGIARARAAPHFRPDVEGLRAVAVTAVVLFHAGVPFVQGGFVGVDIFYVISGYLITGLLLRETASSGRIDVLRFYARRARRLLPVALLVIAVTMAISAVTLSPLQLPLVSVDAATASLYVSNYWFAFISTDYLNVARLSPFLHYWSLGVEEQFYLLWPLFILVVSRWKGGRFIAPAIIGVIVLSLALCITWTASSPSFAFFGLPTRAWELAVGSLLAVIPHAQAGMAVRSRPWLVGLGLVLVVLAVVGISPDHPYPGALAVVPVAGAALLIWGGEGPGVVRRVLTSSVAVWLGRQSYSLYLWHWPVLILVPLAVGRDDLGFRLLLVPVAVALAYLSTRFVEDPFRFGRPALSRSGRTLSVALVSSLAMAVSVMALPEIVARMDPDGGNSRLLVARHDLPRSFSDGCLVGEAGTATVECAYGASDGKDVAVLFGDSHAAQWMGALDVVAQEQGWKLVVHTKMACPPYPVTVWNVIRRDWYHECDRWRDSALHEIERLKPRVVFIGGARGYLIKDDDGADEHDRQADGMQAMLGKLDAHSDMTILLAETPWFEQDPLECLFRDDRRCVTDRRVVLDAGYGSLEMKAAGSESAAILSVNDLLCGSSHCPFVRDGQIVYRDPHHVTSSFMEGLSPEIGDAVDAIVSGRDQNPMVADSSAWGSD